MTTIPQPGLYLYTYPTFVAKAQWVYVHFITSDQQSAFVTYPHHPYQKAAQLVSLNWFESINMIPMDGYSPLMDFLANTLPALVNPFESALQPIGVVLGQFEGYDVDLLLAA
ncbi:hypothetical protein [Spirosoma aerophilum]